MSLQNRFPALIESPRAWIVTGAAGFIGSNLVETLLRLGQRVRGLDNFSTGFRHNLDQVREAVGPEAWARFDFIEGDIRKVEDCRKACSGMDYVLHQAALEAAYTMRRTPASRAATSMCRKPVTFESWLVIGSSIERGTLPSAAWCST